MGNKDALTAQARMPAPSAVKRVLSTRVSPDGFKRRRYDEGGLRHTTIEIPIELYKQHMEASKVYEEAKAKGLLLEGYHYTKVMELLGVPRDEVKQYMRELGLSVTRKSSGELKEKAEELLRKRVDVDVIAARLGLGKSSVYRYKKGLK